MSQSTPNESSKLTAFVSLFPLTKSFFIRLAMIVLGIGMFGTTIAQSVSLDQADLDYAPGETVFIKGTGWQPNEVVTLVVDHLSTPIPDHGGTDPHQPWTVTADANGEFTAQWYVSEYELGADLLLVADGQSSGLTFEVFFADAPSITSISPTSGPTTGGTSVTINGAGFVSNGTITVSFGGVNATSVTRVSNSVLTCITPAHVSGSVNVAVTVVGSGVGNNGTGTLSNGFNYGKVNQTITFANPGTKTYGDADFNLGATASSGLTVTYTVLSGPATIVSGNMLHITGAGSVTVRASQGGNGTYNAATEVDQTFTVNKATATVTVNPYTETYDGLPHTSTYTITGVNSESGATVGTINVSATTHTNAGTYNGDAWSFTGAANYNDANGTVNNSISARDVNVTAQADTKTYDGNTSSSVSPIGDALQGTDTWSTQGTQTYDTKHAGTGKTMTASGASINDGNSGNNYVIHYVTNTSGVIKQKLLTVTAVTDTKVYNGTTSSSASPSVGTLAVGDVVNVSTQVYDNRNVGTNHVLSVSVFSIKDALNADMTGNYNITYQPSPSTGVISVRPIVVAAVTDTKVYDGNNSSDKSPIVPSLQSGDAIGTAPTQTYNNELAGINKTMTATGLVINDGNSGNNYSISYTQNFTGVITLASTTTTLITSAGVVRYMDQFTMTAQVKPLNTGSSLTGNVEFKIGNTVYGSVAAVPIPGDGNGTLQATLIIQVSNMPTSSYTVTATFNSTNSNYSGSIDNKQLQVNPRNASPYNTNLGFYTGSLFAWTTGTNSSTATVTLATAIKDNNNPSGDLRGAKVTFYLVNGTSKTPISGAQNLPVGLVDINDGSVGTASAIVQLNIGSNNAQSFQIAVEVTGAYYNQPNTGEAQAILTISKPVPGGYMVTGGKIQNTNSNGYIRGHSGLYTDFESDIQYTKSGTNPKGKTTVMIRSYYKTDGTLDSKKHTYLITTNAIASLNVAGTSPATATFSAKANLVEQLDDLSIIAIEGGSTFQMVATQNGCTQTVGITLYRKAGGIWFSSNWDGVKTVQQSLSGGQVSVAGGGTCTSNSSLRTSPSTSTTVAIRNPGLAEAKDEFDVKVFGNPTYNTFKLQLQSNDMQQKITVKVVDINGRLVEVQQNLYAGQVIELGANYSQGIYIAEVTQGTQRKVVKLVKAAKN